ncbi:MAG: ABC transporter permease [Spirochaetales bacterium]|nr:ABC transporter permease [Spirochaetales bacterium]
MKQYFIAFTALRYFKALRRSKGFALTLLSIFGLVLGLITLTTVIGVMNGFQLNYINNLLELSSYHLQIESPAGNPLAPATRERIASLPQVAAVVPFRQFQVIFDRADGHSETTPGTVRAVDPSAALKDESFIRHLFGLKYGKNELSIMKADFGIGSPGSVMAGYLLAQYLGVREGSQIVITSVDQISLRGGSPGGEAVSRRYRISSIFKSGYRDIDQSYLFMSLDNSEPLVAPGVTVPLYYGIKLKDRFQDLSVKALVEPLVLDAGDTVKTWRDFNRSYFGALLMEKNIMLFLVGLIFIVVGFMIYNSLRRVVYEKFEEIALLKATGASPAQIRTIFMFEGLLIGLSGGVIGILVGLLVAANINSVFSLVTDAANAVIRFVEEALSLFGLSAHLGYVESPFSPRVFYFREVPSVVIFEEVLFMFLFAVISAVGAAFLASLKISEIKPSEVLHDE